MNLVFATTVCFWGIYYIILRLFLLNYQFILNLRLKLKNNFFTLVYAIFVLLFNYNFQNLKVMLKLKNITIQKKNNIYYLFYIKFLNFFSFILHFFKLNLISELITVINKFYYIGFLKNI